jgi:hypothetical protein
MSFVHIFLDIFFWFEGIDLFWPLSLLGITQPINIWQNIDIPNWLRSFIIVTEFLAFGFYYSFLGLETKRLNINLGYAKILRNVEIGHYLAFFIYCVLILFLSYKKILFCTYVPLLLVCGPVFVWTTLKFGATISMKSET